MGRRLLIAALLVIGMLVPASTTSAQGAPPPAPRSVDDTCFVDAAHQVFLERPATEDEVEEWLDRFADGVNRWGLPDALASSDEWLSVVVAGLYAQALDRGPDAEGEAFWIAQLRAGALVNRVGTLIYGSDEFYNRAGGTDEGFIEDLYVRILGRDADDAGVAFWLDQLEAWGRGQVAAAFFGSNESRTDRVVALYQSLLGRAPDPGGRAHWVEQLRTVNDVRLAVLLASSSEFFNRAQVGCGPPVEVATTSLPEGTVGEAYSTTLAAEGGTPPFTWQAQGLPAGLSLSGDQITGTPTGAGTASVAVTVTDSRQVTGTATLDLVVASPVAVTTASLPPATVDEPYGATLTATGGTGGPYTWQAQGLPAGLSLSGNQITGTPTVLGSSAVTVTATDGAGRSGTATLDLVVAEPTEDLAITPVVLPDATVGEQYLFQLTATGGTGSYSWSGTGHPPGMVQFGSAIAGTPTQTGEFLIEVTVNDGVTSVSRTFPLTVNPAPAVTATDVVVGGSHSCALISDGSVRCWGFSAVGQLGNGSTDPSPTPVTVTGINDATAIAGQGAHTCVLRSNGTVWCWGQGLNGRLGNGGTTLSTVPVQVTGITNAVDVATGGSHSCALLATGEVRCWGLNSTGQLGNGNTTQQLTPVAVTGISDATAIGAGSAFTCAIVTDGAVRCWGSNFRGTLGNGQSGDGTNSSVPVNVIGLTGATQVEGTLYHTCARLTSGELRCWGYNSSGQLGNGSQTSEPVTTPIAVVGVTGATGVTAGGFDGWSCATFASGGPQCWGNNLSGQLGIGTDAVNAPSPTPVSGLSSTTAIAAGSGDHTCAVAGGGSVWCWGGNDNGQLGDGTTTGTNAPVRVSGF